MSSIIPAPKECLAFSREDKPLAPCQIKLDANRVFIAGHSSAGTLALQAAQNDPRIKACAAYCAVTDVPQRLSPILPQLSRKVPGLHQHLREKSPHTNVNKLTCPTFLFTAKDDANVPPTETIRFGEELKKSNANVTVVTVPRGGHYDAMINQGIPQAIAWMKKLP